MATIFGETKFFLKIRIAAVQISPVVKKICRNRSILHGFRDINIFVFLIFAKNSKIQNGRHIW